MRVGCPREIRSIATDPVQQPVTPHDCHEMDTPESVRDMVTSNKRGLDYVAESSAFKSFVSKLQLTILLACGLACVGILVAQNANFQRLIGVGSFVLIILLSRWAQRFGPDVAVKFLAVGMWTVNSIYIFYFAGVHSANVIVYPFLVALCGWILGTRWLNGLVACTLVFLIGIGAAEYLGYFHPTPRAGPILVTLVPVGVMITVAFLTRSAFLGFASSNARVESMSELVTQRNKQLTEQNIKLLQREQEILELNQTLEVRVATRTAELKDAMLRLQQSQEGLARAERLAALGALVAGVSHELNTPIGNSLTTASTVCELSAEIQAHIEAGDVRKSQFLGYVEKMNEGAALVVRNLERAAQLIQSFKQVSVDQTSEMRRHFDLSKVIRDVVTAVQPSLRHQPHRVETSVADGFFLDSYPGPLGQVLINLIQNAYVHAFDEMSEGGVVRLTAKHCELSERPGIQLVVSDNGVGIPSGNLSHIFEPFFTTKMGRGGTGLGLSIAYNIVTELLAGQIEVRSVVGHGTEFTIFLPLAAGQH